MQGQHWQANVDMKLLIDFQRAKTYAVKYVTKAEPTSRDTAQLFQSIMRHATDASWTSTQLRKVFLQMSQVNYIGKGQAAQMLAGGNLYSSTYQFVTVNCDLSIVKLVKDVVSGKMVLGPDIKTFFANRSDHGIHFLFDFGRRFEVKPGKLKQILDPTKIVVKLVPNSVVLCWERTLQSILYVYFNCIFGLVSWRQKGAYERRFCCSAIQTVYGYS
ncbi:hypothetical protein BCR33DRAFT_185785 [Rhizoclosmatium globosum]|uniref:Uncharacterized protein n=1 Tax=Rhizoclosmatium globosum TaxID=329046 RepID=A0A1Y2D1E1_9FUNG|nr:hypothetical protein BCR33DRAFT_185785 [Rhizoclosmatium globosum]|eukprot:ORY53070.1 hypothetical protein BCR33DRAFT_185785 [Rhizoclosmatium globosum]